MNIYKVIFYTLLYFYKKITNKKYVATYPVAVLSTLITLNMLTVYFIYDYFYLNVSGTIHFYYFAIVLIVLTFVNNFIFSNEKEEYQEFLEIKKRKHIVYTILYIVLTFIFLIWIAKLGNTYNTINH